MTVAELEQAVLQLFLEQEAFEAALALSTEGEASC